MSGDRVQAVYAHGDDVPDRLASMAPYLSGWAGGTDQTFADSAVATGGTRHVRYVTDTSCNLDIADVRLSPDGVANFGATRAELAAQGYNRPDRKYLVWVDANVYCGIAHFEWDDRPTQDNINNTTADYARVDAGCWGSVEPHELMHTLGAVQWSAPHATGYGHCTDGPEVMCYQDAASVVMLAQTCKKSDATLFDCNHDDYYNTNPTPGSYLDTHWNVANSAFLEAGVASAPVKGKGH
jgi:hypothetical protein